MIKVKVKNSQLAPKVGTGESAGMDLRVTTDVVLRPGQTEMVGTGVYVEIPEGYFGMVVPRSSLGKIQVGLANTVGIIDSDYRGEIKVMLTNNGSTSQFIEQYDRVVQLVIVPCLTPEIKFVSELNKTDRGEGGFGSTGKK